MRPANEAPADDLRADDLRVDTDELVLAANDDEAADDDAGEPADVDVAVVRPEPRRAPRLARPAAQTVDDGTDEPAASVPRPSAEPLAEQDVDDSVDGDEVDEVDEADALDAADIDEDDVDEVEAPVGEPEAELPDDEAADLVVPPVEEAAAVEVTEDASPPIDVPNSAVEVAATHRSRRAAARAEREEGEDATHAPDLLSAVERLRTHTATLNLTLEVEGAPEARREREGLVSQLDDYILPRLRRKDAPLLAVIGGSTGAGKSTLTNSLVRREVSRSGVLRPTTRSPVLVHHPYDSGAFLSQRILPRLTRVTSEAPEPLQPIDPNAPRITGLRLVPHDGITPGMAIIDAPDIDSLVETNRDLAVQLLAAADLWLFVTTAARYADAMPWQMLRQAAERGVAVAVVLDRVPPEALAELRVHLAQRLRERGLGGAPLFVIPETEPVDGFLPEEVVLPLQQWLRRVAGDERSRTVIAERTLKGVLGSLPERTLTLADAADAQALAWYKLKQEIDVVFEPVREQLLRAMTDGSLISGEVAARWQEFVAEGEFVRRLDGGPHTLAERVSAAVQRDGEVVEPLDVPVTEAIVATIKSAVRSATEAVTSRWRQYPYGQALADQPVPEFEATLDRSIRDWRVQVSAGVTAAVQAQEKTVDEETAADVLFVVAVDERADAIESADSIGAARRILGRFLGDDDVRTLVTEVRLDLVARAAVVLDQERQRLEKVLSGGGATARGESLRTAAAVLKEAR